MVRERDLAQFLVKVIGTPKPTVTWKRNNAVLDDKELYQFESYEDTHCFEIKVAEVTDTGDFTCVATNTEGQATCDIPLVVNGKSYLSFSDLSIVLHCFPMIFSYLFSLAL